MRPSPSVSQKGIPFERLRDVLRMESSEVAEKMKIFGRRRTIKRIAKKNPEIFERLFHRHFQMFYHYCS